MPCRKLSVQCCYRTAATLLKQWCASAVAEAAVVVVAAVGAFAVVAVEQEQVLGKAHMCIVVFAGQGSSLNAMYKHMARTAKGQPLVALRLYSQMELRSLSVKMLSLGFQMQEVHDLFALTLHGDLQMAAAL